MNGSCLLMIRSFRFDRTPLLFGVLIFPLAATGALANAGFFISQSGELRVAFQSPRAIMADRERAGADALETAPTDEELESLPKTHPDPTAGIVPVVAHQRLAIHPPCHTRAIADSIADLLAGPVSPRAPPVI
jgi:hypothetical protein